MVPEPPDIPKHDPGIGTYIFGYWLVVGLGTKRTNVKIVCARHVRETHAVGEGWGGLIVQVLEELMPKILGWGSSCNWRIAEAR